MAKRLGLLAGSVDFSNAAADEFHDWLDTEHIPERTRLPGILNAVRWLGVERPTASLVIYDLENLDVRRVASSRKSLHRADGARYNRRVHDRNKRAADAPAAVHTCREVLRARDRNPESKDRFSESQRTR